VHRTLVVEANVSSLKLHEINSTMNPSLLFKILMFFIILKAIIFIIGHYKRHIPIANSENKTNTFLIKGSSGFNVSFNKLIPKNSLQIKKGFEKFWHLSKVSYFCFIFLVFLVTLEKQKNFEQFKFYIDPTFFFKIMRFSCFKLQFGQVENNNSCCFENVHIFLT